MVLLLGIASVSAQQNTTDTVSVTNDNDDVVVHSDFDKNLTSSKSDDILAASKEETNVNLRESGNTFADLQSEIDKNPTQYTLTKNYKIIFNKNILRNRRSIF